MVITSQKLMMGRTYILKTPSGKTCGHDYGNIGNLEEQIPDPLPAIQGKEGEEEASAITGNPDIRVPEGLERDNGLNAQRALFIETAEGEDAEEGDAERRGRTPNPLRRTQEKAQRSLSPGDTTTGKEGPEGRELCHVTGGTWLNQVRSCLQDSLRLIIGREGSYGRGEECKRGVRGGEQEGRIEEGHRHRTECRPDETCGHDYGNIGNPEERIPDPLPAIQGEEDASAITGNRDIRVPEGLERDNGLKVQRALFIETAEGDDLEKGDAERRGRTPNQSRRTQEKAQRSPSPGDTTMGKEGPEGRELRHVPGGTWLNQVQSCLQDSLRLIIGTEGSYGREEECKRGVRGGEQEGKREVLKKGTGTVTRNTN
ncbi:hypothetical protein NDU88_001564 [Pleurodeles waltl]|uniref:Uncharacterized protein n=1 Tax=Pleurodeles waltl TaxID=8319 RepID=A0AAV7T0W2_PLEWA|nr:hypothetical protein NDU88_001564 [Pleurodeles waltl]